jgi:serine/threonine-protein kinase HipA
MRTAKVYVNELEAGFLTEIIPGKEYHFKYRSDYEGIPVSLTMPVNKKFFSFDGFPPFFEGLLPEGHQLEGLIIFGKVDRHDLFSQLMIVGNDMTGVVRVEEVLL